MTDELLTKLDAAEAASVESRRRLRARRCCDVIVRLVVASLLLGLVFLIAWTLRITVLEKPFFVAFLPGVVGASRPDWPSISAAGRCAAAFFDDFLAPCVLFFGLKVFKSFSTMMVSVENWKPAKKGKINEVPAREHVSLFLMYVRRNDVFSILSRLTTPFPRLQIIYTSPMFSGTRNGCRDTYDVLLHALSMEVDRRFVRAEVFV